MFGLCVLQLCMYVYMYACMHSLKNGVEVQRGRLHPPTLLQKCNLLHIFEICCYFSLFLKYSSQSSCFPTIHRVTVWFMNSLTWRELLYKIGADEGVLEVRWAVGELLLRRSHHVWRLCPNNSVATSSHENFQGGRGRCTTQPPYLMKNLSEVDTRIY